jgi:RNA polymerase sigma-70 factor (ECF subfamily)
MADGQPAADARYDAKDSGFTAFYHAEYGRLTGQLYAYLGDAAEAEDVVQEAYTRAWQRWGSVSRYDNPVAWVRRVAWNLATSRLRRIVVAARSMRRHRVPEEVLATGPERVALVTALVTLPERQRQAVVLHYIGDLSVAEVADQLGVPNGTVLSWLSRGRSRLAAQLSELDDASLRRGGFHG